MATRSRSPEPQPPSSEPSEALARLKNGEISLAEYLDAKADQAVAHLRGLVPEAQLRTIRELVREQLETDPVCTALVQRAIGQTQGKDS